MPLELDTTPGTITVVVLWFMTIVVFIEILLEAITIDFGTLDRHKSPWLTPYLSITYLDSVFYRAL